MTVASGETRQANFASPGKPEIAARWRPARLHQISDSKALYVGKTRMFPSDIGWRGPEPAGNGAGESAGRGIAEPVADIGDWKIAFHQQFETGVLADRVLYFVEICAEFGEPPLETSFRQVEVGRNLTERQLGIRQPHLHVTLHLVDELGRV